MKYLQKKAVSFFILTLVILIACTLFLGEGIGFANGNNASGLNCDAHELGVEIATLYGKISGTEDENNTWSWKGIPFAKPPVGNLRWKAPQDPEPWEGVKDTMAFASPCVQYDGSTTGPQNVIGSEDCLYLNIWRPRTQECNLPVYFWIHGGGNSIGSAVPYPGQSIAGNGNMVVVTIQYRLGPFGWFTHPGLRKGLSLLDDSGNYGTLDIIKALNWVKKNIAAFGGNPYNVMATGESTGATSVYTMIISRLATGLFQKALVESGGLWLTTIKDADTESEVVINALLAKDGFPEVPNGNVEAYLKGKSAAEIMRAYTPGQYGLIRTIINNTGHYGYRLGCYLDGYVIPKTGINALFNPQTYNQVPLIAGANKEETKLFNAPLYETWDPGQWGGLSYQKFNMLSSKKDWIIDSVDFPVAMMRSHESQPPIYAYQLNYGAYHVIGYNAWPTSDKAIQFGACHTIDVPLLWQNYPFLPPLADLFREDNRAGYESLSQAMRAYVAEFAHTGNPGDAGGVLWGQWSNTPGEEKRILFDANDQTALIEMSNN
jgi:para-nitrobenzyl esterase